VGEGRGPQRDHGVWASRAGMLRKGLCALVLQHAFGDLTRVRAVLLGLNCRAQALNLAGAPDHGRLFELCRSLCITVMGIIVVDMTVAGATVVGRDRLGGSTPPLSAMSVQTLRFRSIVRCGQRDAPWDSMRRLLRAAQYCYSSFPTTTSRWL